MYNIYMFIEPTITWVPSGFSGYIWLDTKIVFLKKIWSRNYRSSLMKTRYYLANHMIFGAIRSKPIKTSNNEQPKRDPRREITTFPKNVQ